jgi:Transposase DDE domain group 1
VIRLDATLQTAHSEKQHAAPTYKHTFGFHPLTAWCDNTRESLAFLLRPGNAGANTVADHLTVLDEAITQTPRRAPPRPADHLRRCRRHPGVGAAHHRAERPAWIR